MENKMRRLCLIAAALVVTSCGWMDVRHDPVITADKAAAVQTVERSLWEQYRDFTPDAVVVTQKYFRATKNQTNSTSTVYYDNIGMVDLYKKRSLYQVVLRAKSGEDAYRYYQVNKEKAEAFVDAIETLRH